jgi:hypothetical protein
MLAEFSEVTHSNHWPRIPGQNFDRAGAEDGINSAPLVAKLGEIGAVEHGVRVLQSL